MKSVLRVLFVVVLVLPLIYVTGPSPQKPHLDMQFHKVTSDLLRLRDSINNQETILPLKPDNEARIIFANDSVPAKTTWAMVYLHGFSASQEEGNPVHREVAERFGMNLFLARLSDHGIKSDEPLLEMTPERLWESAKRALSVACSLGDSVLVMSTSTGGTLALMLAARYPEKVNGLINYSPNIRINDPMAFLLNNPWGLQIARLTIGNKYLVTLGADDPVISQYWNTKYRIEALVQLEELLESQMNESLFEKIRTPCLTLAYYKDEQHQDPVVKVSAMQWMNEHLGTPDSMKRLVLMPNVGVHPMASALRSKDILSVVGESGSFLESVLRLKFAIGHKDDTVTGLTNTNY